MKINEGGGGRGGEVRGRGKTKNKFLKKYPVCLHSKLA